MTSLPDYGEALGHALRSAGPLADLEDVPLAAADGRVLREPVAADRDLPPRDRARMDGYALRAAEVGRQEAWPVAGRVAAGDPGDGAVPAGRCVAIATGAPLPPGVDTVIQHELSDRGDPVRFTIDAIAPGHAVHPRGADARRGDVLLAPPLLLGPHHVGIAAAVGRATLRVTRRPRVIVLTSGDEVRAANEPVAPHQIRNSNAPMVAALVARFGAVAVEHRHLADEAEVTAGAVVDAVAAARGGCDLLVTIGGVSVGERDHFPAAFDAHGVVRSLTGAAIQPGKPILVGRAPGGTIVVGLPGNPVSSLACACLFVWPIVRVLLGLDPALPWREAVMAAAVTPNPRRRAFRPAALGADGRVTVPEWAGSGDLAHTAGTHGLAELPVREEPVAEGERVRFLPWP